MSTTDTPGIDLAIGAAGGQVALAALVGCSQQNVSFWKQQGYAPLLRAVEIEQATGIPRAKLVDPRILDILDPSLG